MSILPKGQKIPSQSSYAKLSDGDNRFRVIQKPLAGYCAWAGGKKVHKLMKEEFDGIVLDQPKYPGAPVKYFWAMSVWSYSEERVMILEITQKQIMTALDQLDDNAKWGGITKHDINIMRGESGGKVVYTVIAEPGELNSEVKEKIAKTTVNLKNLFTGENPFERTFVRKDEGFDADVDAGLDGITF